MESKYLEIAASLRRNPATWLVTGAAGFIGSHLAQRLLELGQSVVGLDNYSTGSTRNVEDVRRVCGDAAERFRMLHGDIADLTVCAEACEGVEYVLHQAALGSVPRSIDDPLSSNAANVTGFLHMLIAARDAPTVKTFVYAASSAAYGDEPSLPKVEERIGSPLSPYAVTKVANELYARVFGRLYGMRAIGLRYFNVFGPRQDPEGAYAAVIPRWIGNLLMSQPCEIYGDGSTSRDFCFIENVIQANILAATTEVEAPFTSVYNIACGGRTTLVALYELIRGEIAARRPSLTIAEAQHVAPRPGDVKHSLADVSKARSELGYEPGVQVKDGIAATVQWFIDTGSTTRA